MGAVRHVMRKRATDKGMHRECMGALSGGSGHPRSPPFPCTGCAALCLHDLPPSGARLLRGFRDAQLHRLTERRRDRKRPRLQQVGVDQRQGCPSGVGRV